MIILNVFNTIRYKRKTIGKQKERAIDYYYRDIKNWKMIGRNKITGPNNRDPLLSYPNAAAISQIVTEIERYMYMLTRIV